MVLPAETAYNGRMTAPPGLQDFVRTTTEIVVPPLVPELRLRLAQHAHDIFQLTETFVAGRPLSGGWCARPYWAFAWPGGQALARCILDHPELVAGRRVLDLGAGSAIAGIAAVKAGAISVCAADIDPLAAAVARLNGALNGVALEVTTDDLLDAESTFDLVVIGDVIYEPALKARVGAFIAALRSRATPILYGDRTSAPAPPGPFGLLAEYEASLTPAMADDHVERARVWLG